MITNTTFCMFVALNKCAGSGFRTGLLAATSRRDCVLEWRFILGQGRTYSHMKLLRKQRISHRPDPVEAPRLTPQMVTSILKMNEKVEKVTGGVVKAVYSNQLQVGDAELLKFIYRAHVLNNFR